MPIGAAASPSASDSAATPGGGVGAGPHSRSDFSATQLLRMTTTDKLLIEALMPDQAEGAAPLSVEAGWNQIAADWRLMLA